MVHNSSGDYLLSTLLTNQECLLVLQPVRNGMELLDCFLTSPDSFSSYTQEKAYVIAECQSGVIVDKIIW